MAGKVGVFTVSVLASLVAVGIATTSTVLTIQEQNTRRSGSRNLVGYLNQKVEWRACPAVVQDPNFASASRQGSDYDCTFVRVPAIYVGSDFTPDFRIVMMRKHFRLNKHPLGTIFINPGGPGGSGNEQLQQTNFAPQLIKKYDFIGFDPRGVGFSFLEKGHHFACSNVLAYQRLFGGSGFIGSEVDYQNYAKRSNRYFAQCAKNNPYWFTISTQNVVNDLEVMRQVITGSKPLNFIGSSAGATIGALYATTYQAHAGKIVLDSAPNLSRQPVDESDWQDAQETRLEQLFSGYAKHAKINMVEAVQRFEHVKRWAEKGELYGTIGDQLVPKLSDEYGMTFKSKYAFIRYGIFALAYYPLSFGQQQFNQALDEAYLQKWATTFEWLASNYFQMNIANQGKPSLSESEISRSSLYDVHSLMNGMTASATEAPNIGSPKSIARQIDADKQSAAKWPLLDMISSPSNEFHHYGPSLINGWAEIARSDPNIPDPPAIFAKLTRTAGNHILVVTAEDDLITPESGGITLANTLHSFLLSVQKGGHAIAGRYSNSCVNTHLVEFFGGKLAQSKDFGHMNGRPVIWCN